MPLAWTLEFLGDPNWGVILSGYIGVILLAMMLLSIGIFCSAFCWQPSAAFLLSTGACLFFLFLGWNVLGDLLSNIVPESVVQAIANLGFFPHYESMARGVIDGQDLLYFFF